MRLGEIGLGALLVGFAGLHLLRAIEESREQETLTPQPLPKPVPPSRRVPAANRWDAVAQDVAFEEVKEEGRPV